MTFLAAPLVSNMSTNCQRVCNKQSSLRAPTFWRPFASVVPVHCLNKLSHFCIAHYLVVPVAFGLYVVCNLLRLLCILIPSLTVCIQFQQQLP
jgi:hypothetical protein